MQKRLNHFMLLFVILAVVMTSAFRTTTVHADDGVTEPPTGESTPPPEAGTPPEEAPAQEPAAATEVPAAEPVAATEVPAVEEPAPVTEVLEQLPEDTELVVVNEAGEAEPLASTQAAEILTTGDPMWCPNITGSELPGDAGCTPSFGTFEELIDELANPANGYAGAGIVWVADSYSNADVNQIAFEGNSPDDTLVGNLPNLSGSDLTIRGGWSGTLGDGSITGTSDLNVSLVVAFWTGNVTIENIAINTPTDDAGFGLLVTGTTGNVTLDNVSISGVTPSSLAPLASGEGAIIETTGDVTVTGSHFDTNTAEGLAVLTARNVTMTSVSASGNTTSGVALDATGTVTVTGANIFAGNGLRGLSVFTDGDVSLTNILSDHNGTGLYIDTLGNVTLASVNAYANNMGAEVYTDYGTGTIIVNNSFFGTGGPGNTGDVGETFLGNNWTGLHAISGGDITLNDMEASGNQNNGAYLEAEGNIFVQDSIFDNNVRNCICVDPCGDPGLYAWSNGGAITLTNVLADGNVCGAGTVLDTSGAGTITVTDGEFDRNGGNGLQAHSGDGAITLTGDQFNENSTYGVQAQSDNGNITLDGITASYNGVKGAYLNAGGTGNITIRNFSDFVENGSYGIYANASQGNIELEDVTVTGDDGVATTPNDNLTDYGAVLTTGSGHVWVTDSTFELNTEVGLKVVSGGPVVLTNVTANQNGGNGVEVYSTSTVAPICPEDKVVNIAVSVDGGIYTNNDGWGLMVKPGPEGTLVFVNPSTFGGNTLGDYLLDLSQEYKDCTPAPEEPPCEPKEPLIVEVPETGGPEVEQDCNLYSSTILKLPNGTWVKVGCPFYGYSQVEKVFEDGLPGTLGASLQYIDAISLGLTDIAHDITLNEDGTITINFTIPADSHARRYSILFWDPMLNDGKGGWIELPPYEVGTSFQLHPEDSSDGRTIVSGVQRTGNLVTVTVDFSGVFVLVGQ